MYVFNLLSTQGFTEKQKEMVKNNTLAVQQREEEILSIAKVRWLAGFPNKISF
jgi:hypothetical protein